MKLTKIFQHLTKRGLKRRLQRLDNEASKLLQDEMDKHQIQWQLVSPGNHRRNVAERQIRTFKNHFISILSGTDPEFPLHLWDKLIPQACITIKPFHNSHRNPHLSAKDHLNGNLDYNTTSLASPGTKVLAFEPSDKGNTWETHVTLLWYIGQAPHHYRYWKIYVTKTAATGVCDTVKFIPKQFKMSLLSSADTATRAALDLTEELQHLNADLSYVTLRDNTITELKEISNIFTNVTQANPTLPS